MMKQCYYFSLLFIIINISFVLTDSNTTYVNSTNVNSTQTNSSITKLDSANSTNVVQTEGGQIDVLKNIHHVGREHVTTTVLSTTVKNIETSVPQELKTKDDTVSSISTSKKNTEIPTVKTEHHTDSRVKARKGVSLNETLVTEQKIINATTASTKVTQQSSTMSTSTQKSTTRTISTTFIPMKPTVTFGSDEEDPPLHISKSRVFLGGKQIDSKNSSSISSVVAGDPVIVGNRHKKGSDYVLPIVLTILAVPLMAIILTVVYKRGAEWWSHRHYRRMDFLIDGMYNN